MTVNRNICCAAVYFYLHINTINKYYLNKTNSNYKTMLLNSSILKPVKSLTAFASSKPLKTSAVRHSLAYAAASPLPLPNNVDAAETTRFSPQRSRDISANVVLSQAPISTIDITTDNTMSAMNAAAEYASMRDPHVQSYDCFGAVSLNAVMQSNVPTPFGGMHKFSHLNMPGGQWSQEYKFMSQNLHSSHYNSLREAARVDWVAYDQNSTLKNKGLHSINSSSHGSHIQPHRSYTTGTHKQELKVATDDNTEPKKVLSKKEQLKKAFKDYGTTIVLFHVGISLISLGGCYLLVSGGINMMPVLEFLGISSGAIADKVATGSTFVVAYAIHKVFAPVRISITLGAAPFIVRYLRSKGFLKLKIK